MSAANATGGNTSPSSYPVARIPGQGCSSHSTYCEAIERIVDNRDTRGTKFPKQARYPKGGYSENTGLFVGAPGDVCSHPGCTDPIAKLNKDGRLERAYYVGLCGSHGDNTHRICLKRIAYSEEENIPTINDSPVCGETNSSAPSDKINKKSCPYLYANVSQNVFDRLSLPHVSVDAFIKELPTVCQPTFEHKIKRAPRFSRLIFAREMAPGTAPGSGDQEVVIVALEGPKVRPKEVLSYSAFRVKMLFVLKRKYGNKAVNELTPYMVSRSEDISVSPVPPSVATAPATSTPNERPGDKRAREETDHSSNAPRRPKQRHAPRDAAALQVLFLCAGDTVLLCDFGSSPAVSGCVYSCAHADIDFAVYGWVVLCVTEVTTACVRWSHDHCQSGAQCLHGTRRR